jgi:uncharacterized membrane protein YphA (DoxX/SURF4 family)
MPTFSTATVLQLVLALGLMNVWLLRAASPTPYRGGKAQSLKEEFGAYGLPGWFFFLVGALKLGSAAFLLIGLWLPSVVLPAASVVVALMLGALAMHLKVKDPPIKSLPAFGMLAMSATLCALRLT